MNYLSNARVYLGGPIEYINNDENWFDKVSMELKNQFNLNLYIPAKDPKQQFSEMLIKSKENCDFEAVRKIAKGFVKKDLALVDRSDFTIHYLPYKVLTCGSHHEIIWANQAKKPTLIVCPEGINKIPTWYFGFIKQEFFFGSWKSLYSYLEEVNNGNPECNTHHKWDFVYQLI